MAATRLPYLLVARRARAAGAAEGAAPLITGDSAGVVADRAKAALAGVGRATVGRG